MLNNAKYCLLAIRLWQLLVAVNLGETKGTDSCECVIHFKGR